MIFQGMAPCLRQPLARMNIGQNRSWFENTAVQIRRGHSDEKNEVSEEIFDASRAFVKSAVRSGIILQTHFFGFWTDLGRPGDFATAGPGSGGPAKFLELSETFLSSRRLLAGRLFMDWLPKSSKILRPPSKSIDFL